MTEDKLPPFDIAAERAVVASLLVDPGALDRVDDLVAVEDFHRDECRWVFAVCKALSGRGETLNQVTAAHELAREHVLEQAGGVAFLSQIIDELPTPIGVEHYAGIVRRDARWRRLIAAAQRIVQTAYAGGPDVDGAITDAEAMLKAIGDSAAGDEARPLSALLDEHWDQPGISLAATRTVRTGFMDLDALLGGLRPGNLIVVAAQTGIGKSLFLLHLARNAAVGQNFRSLVFSMEMSGGEWTERLLSHESGIPTDRLRVGSNSDADERRAMTATAALHDLPVYFDDRPYQTIDGIRARARRTQARLGGLDMLLVDYLQLAGGKPKRRQETTRAQEVGEISRGLKLLARELDIPVVAAAQLNRNSDPFHPKLSDLRESGSIEQDADVVLFLVPVMHDGKVGGLEVRVAKHRNGPTGRVFLRYNATTARIEDMHPVEEPDTEYQQAMGDAR